METYERLMHDQVSVRDKDIQGIENSLTKRRQKNTLARAWIKARSQCWIARFTNQRQRKCQVQHKGLHLLPKIIFFHFFGLVIPTMSAHRGLYAAVICQDKKGKKNTRKQQTRLG